MLVAGESRRRSQHLVSSSYQATVVDHAEGLSKKSKLERDEPRKIQTPSKAEFLSKVLTARNKLETLERNHRFVEEDDDMEEDEVVVFDNISLAVAIHGLESVEKTSFRVAFQPMSELEDWQGDPKRICGKLIATELPSATHEAASSAVIDSIQNSIFGFGFNRLDRSPSPRCMIGGFLKEPDGTMRPKILVIGGAVLDNGFGHPFPNLVVEIAFHHESLPDLRFWISQWISGHTSVQCVIGVKIFRRDRMLAIHHRRVHGPHPFEQVEFGAPGPCPDLHVHLSDVFFGVAPAALPAALAAAIAAGGTVAIDLGQLRAEIQDLMDHEHPPPGRGRGAHRGAHRGARGGGGRGRGRGI